MVGDTLCALLSIMITSDRRTWLLFQPYVVISLICCSHMRCCEMVAFDAYRWPFFWGCRRIPEGGRGGKGGDWHACHGLVVVDDA